MRASFKCSYEKSWLCSANKRLVLPGRVSTRKSGAEISTLTKLLEFINPYWALLFLSISGLEAGMASARSGVTPLVLPAWNRMLPWPLDFPCIKPGLYFYPPITLLLAQNKMFQVRAEDVCRAHCICWSRCLTKEQYSVTCLLQLPA